MQLSIPGKPVSQKNAKKIAINRKTGRPFVTSKSVVEQWHRSAAKLLARHRGNNLEPVAARLDFYLGPRQSLDTDNMIAAPLDALQKAKVIRNDNSIDLIVAQRHKNRRDQPGTDVVLWEDVNTCPCCGGEWRME